MANLTLKIDDQLLEKARRLASIKRTTINAVVRRELEEFVSSDLSRQAALKGLESFYNRCEARIGRKNWIRDEIHDR